MKSRTLIVIAAFTGSAGVATADSFVEPGSQNTGDWAIQVGVGLGDGPSGLGTRSIVSLGRIDVGAGVGYIPRYCVFGGCDEAEVLAHVGVGASLHDARSVRLGARVQYDLAVVGDDGLRIASGGLRLSGGSARIRWFADAGLLFSHEDGNPFDENGYYATGTTGVRIQLRPRGVATVLSLGPAVPMSGQSEWRLVGAAAVEWPF